MAFNRILVWDSIKCGWKKDDKMPGMSIDTKNRQLTQPLRRRDAHDDRTFLLLGEFLKFAARTELSWTIGKHID